MEKGDFILLDLEGKDEQGNVFDSTNGEIAKKLYGKEGPMLVIVGYSGLLKGIHQELLKMKEGEQRKIILPPKNAFGERDKNNLLVVTRKEFKQPPKIGDIVQVMESSLGVVKSITSGRVMIDLNHPLAGKVLFFNLKIAKHIKTEEEKAKQLLKESNLKDYEFKEKTIIVNGADKEQDQILDSFEKLFKDFNIGYKIIRKR